MLENNRKNNAELYFGTIRFTDFFGIIINVSKIKPERGEYYGSETT